ncbi:hypothetical protein Pcinc_014593 [Petrolisthes cinctipes]|uniref:Reverse transcriptase domain-containing protein n=1 Tax=Petrolisthes cinctipes TaxID=88211 RepID=A0AAE1KR87_PETCI|nr:hypothetical protein Pcinc_014593 [Petrolisthes cinctipes]
MMKVRGQHTDLGSTLRSTWTTRLDPTKVRGGNFLNYIYSNIERRKTSVALTFIDFRKAFDLVDHMVIINKVINLGLHLSLVERLADFLSDRRQAMRYQARMIDYK